MLANSDTPSVYAPQKPDNAEANLNLQEIGGLSPSFVRGDAGSDLFADLGGSFLAT